MEGQATKRLQKEFEIFQKEAKAGLHPNIKVGFYDNNIMSWYYLFHKLDDPYTDGVYMGEIKFPKDYPFSAPVINMLTPNGRFQAGVNLCVAGLTHYHNGSWSSMYKTPEVLVGLLSFFYDDKDVGHVGYERSNKETRRILAGQSRAYNEKIKAYRDLFMDEMKSLEPSKPVVVKEEKKIIEPYPITEGLTEEEELQLALEQIAVMESKK